MTGELKTICIRNFLKKVHFVMEKPSHMKISLIKFLMNNFSEEKYSNNKALGLLSGLINKEYIKGFIEHD